MPEENEQRKVTSPSQGIAFQTRPVLRKEIPQEPKKVSGIRFKSIFHLLGVVFAAGLILAGILFGIFLLYTNTRDIDTSAETIKEVGLLVDLPQNETPTVATVTDLEALKNQDFFADGKIGDKVLIFSESKKAILYRPSEKKIIAIGPLNK